MAKRYCACFCTLLLVLLLLCFCGCKANVPLNRGRSINSVNHRGYHTAPENTLAAFALSKQKGFDMVECDVSFTKDNVAVLLHDTTIDRTSDGTGKIGELTFDEVRQFDFGGWKDSNYKGEAIPTFAEFVDLCLKIGLHPYVEIKGNATVDQAQSLANIVADKGLVCTWIGRNKNVLQHLAKVRPDDRFGLLVTIITRKDVDFVSGLIARGYDAFVDCNYSHFTDIQLNMCKKVGVPVEVWTLNNIRQIANVHPYVSGITSDKVHAEHLFANL